MVLISACIELVLWALLKLLQGPLPWLMCTFFTFSLRIWDWWSLIGDNILRIDIFFTLPCPFLHGVLSLQAILLTLLIDLSLTSFELFFPLLFLLDHLLSQFVYIIIGKWYWNSPSCRTQILSAVAFIQLSLFATVLALWYRFKNWIWALWLVLRSFRVEACWEIRCSLDSIISILICFIEIIYPLLLFHLFISIIKAIPTFSKFLETSWRTIPLNFTLRISLIFNLLWIPRLIWGCINTTNDMIYLEMHLLQSW